MKDPFIYECFTSHACINGKKIPVNVADSEQMKLSAIFHDFLDEEGHTRDDLKPLEQILVLLREVTTAEPFNHEWWAAEFSKPEWVLNLDDLFFNCWLRFKITDEIKDARKIAENCGYSLTLNERIIARTIKDSAFRKRWEDKILEDAKRGFAPENSPKVKVILVGNENLEEFASEAYLGSQVLRDELFSLAGKLPFEQYNVFIKGLSVGTNKASKIDLEDELSEFRERQEIAQILQNDWNIIDKMKNRTVITRWILDHLPDKRRKFLEGKDSDQLLDRK